MNTVICLPKFGITTRDSYISVMEAWVAHQESTQSRVSFNCFPHFLALSSFLGEAKHTFTNFPIAHHNLGSSRATPSRLGGFTSKSSKCHEYYFPKLKCSSLIKRFSLNPKHGFITNHSNLTKRCWGEVSMALCLVFLLLESAASKGGRGRSFYIVPQKLAVGNQPVEIGTSDI
jgi:hypothetical protein